MTQPRRYDEGEIAAIFERASAAQDARLDAAGTRDGLTLAQLHEIGRDVGLAPAHITRAAEAVSRGDLVPTQRRTWLGLPVGVSRTVDFGRPVSDAEWNRLVGTLRETFDARGRIVTEGEFRQWHNGNLQALLEPTPHGHRLRLSTRKGNARPMVMLGAGYLALGSLVATLATFGVVGDKGLLGGAVLGGVGLFALGAAFINLPQWARTRASQMESIAAEAARTLPVGAVAPERLPATASLTSRTE